MACSGTRPAQEREHAAQELVRSAQQRSMAQADLHGPGRQLARQILAQAIRAAAERKAAAPRGPSTGFR